MNIVVQGRNMELVIMRNYVTKNSKLNASLTALWMLRSILPWSEEGLR